MRKCCLFINHGRNVHGVYNDAIKYLASKGWEPGRIYIVALPGDNATAFHSIDPLSDIVNVDVLEVERDGRVDEYRIDDDKMPRIFVVNGGTTPQAWFHARELASYQAERLELASPPLRRPGDPVAPIPSIFLDVQRDGVTILAGSADIDDPHRGGYHG